MYTLKNTINSYKQNSLVFNIPLNNQINEIEVNDMVRLIFCEENKESEYLWVIVKKITKTNEMIDYVGILASAPFNLMSVNIKNEIMFNNQNIFQIGSKLNENELVEYIERQERRQLGNIYVRHQMVLEKEIEEGFSKEMTISEFTTEITKRMELEMSKRGIPNF